jgi:trk system potassium uptake protein TrkA
MRVIVVGAGEVGYQITKFLAMEGIDVVVVEKDPKKIGRVSDELDVATIVADGCSPHGLKEAGAENADIFLAVTDSDETNMIACMLAKAMLKIPRKIARLRNPEYFRNEKLLSKENLDINPAISPEMEVANAIIKRLETPFATDVEELEDGLIKVIGFRIPEGSDLTGKTLKSIPALEPPKKFLIGIIERDGNVTIPTGDDTIEPDDVIYMPVKKWEVGDAIKLLHSLLYGKQGRREGDRTERREMQVHKQEPPPCSGASWGWLGREPSYRGEHCGHGRLRFSLKQRGT